MILVTGASGLLGANLVWSALRAGDEVAAQYHAYPVHFPAVQVLDSDLTQPSSVRALVRAVKPDWIVHCAAATDVDWCEEHPAEAARINVEAAGNVAAAAKEARARLLLVSTDAVFDGRRGGYSEKDAPAPLNVYGATKRAGEQAVLKAVPSALIVRTNLYGWNVQPKQSLAEWVLGRLERGETVPGFEDVSFTPILADELGEMLLAMTDRSLEGTYHVAGSESLTKYEFARRVANVFGLDARSVHPVRIESSSLRAPRPRNTTLRTEAAARALGRPMPTADSGLRRFRADRDSGYVEKLKACRGG